MHNMARRLLQHTALLQPTALLQRTTPLKGIALLESIPVELTVDLPVKPTPAVLPPTLLALVHRPIAFPLKHMPLKALARGSGTRVRVRRNEAMNASPTLISTAVTASEGRAKSERNHSRRVVALSAAGDRY
jgi:hypothetical protein